MGKQIVVTVDVEGDTTVEVEGCVGPACESLTAGIELALGSRTKRTRKPEYHRRAEEERHEARRAGR